MTDRDQIIMAFLAEAGWGDAKRGALAGDASARRYERLAKDGERAVLMDAPPEPSENAGGAAIGYSAIAHLAVDCQPFIAIDLALREAGLSAPELWRCDARAGLLLMEDLGDNLYVTLLDNGADADARELYGAAVDVLCALHESGTTDQIDDGAGGSYQIPHYDAPALQIETDLVIDWFLPAFKDVTAADRSAYRAAWADLIPHMAEDDPVLCLRDFHAGNLLWLPERGGLASVGLLDFQDALMGSRAYDLVSLLQDARRDVDPALEAEMIKRYLSDAKSKNAGFDEEDFRLRYALLGAQRNAKIVGIFMRLWLRDGKPGYLQHLPRVWRYLTQNLAHPGLSNLRAWFDESAPPEIRAHVPAPEELRRVFPPPI
jgi:hypothetical protein